MKKTDIEWKNRVLCSDGNCIGVLGPDGRCKECGLPYEGELPFEKELPAPAQAGSDETMAATSEGEPNREADPENAAADEQAETTGDEEWDNRRLCRDGNCIGIIGPDGMCKECGQPYDT